MIGSRPRSAASGVDPRFLVASLLGMTEKRSPSGLPIAPVYRPEDGSVDYARELGDPGTFPYTRGIQPTMYRGRLWTMRQYAGFGTAQETNKRFRLLLEAGQTGLSV